MCCSKEIVIFVVTIVTLVSGCSEPEGGYVEPTPADKVFYSTNVVVGTVTELIPDPIYRDMYGNSTYGATVRVRCSYKGGVLGDSITVGGAGKGTTMKLCKIAVCLLLLSTDTDYLI